MDVPLEGQLRIIHQGRFLEDNKALSEHKVAEGEQTAMHLIIKSEVSKPTGMRPREVVAALPVLGARLPCTGLASDERCLPCVCAESASASDDKAPKCSCIVC